MLLLVLAALSISFSDETGVAGPLTPDFQSWLNRNGYSRYNFSRLDYGTQGSFGGKTNTCQKANNIPVVFVHGNTDSALQTDDFSTGWDISIAYFLSKGYTTAELYATSWGDNKLKDSSRRTHNCNDILRLRQFLQAVLDYTERRQISIISHSMGVTMIRKAIKGGDITANDGNCNVGPPISNRINIFVGLAGANYGMCNCEGAAPNVELSCNKQNGLWPGDSCGLNTLTCGISPLPWPCSGPIYSSFLMDLNQKGPVEADKVFSVWSLADNIIDYGDMVWGKPTSLIPFSTGSKVYTRYTHMQTKEKTAPDQYVMVNNGRIPN